jgi:hypothetical protein
MAAVSSHRSRPSRAQPGGPALPTARPGGAHGHLHGVPAGGQDHGRGGDQQAGQRGASSPSDRRQRGGAEAGGVERQPPDRHCGRQAGDDAEHGDGGGGLHQRQADELAGGGAAGAQQGLLAAAALAAGSGGGVGEQAGQDRAGQAEEHKEHLRVQRVGACRRQRRAEVVAHQTGTGQPRLQVARRAGDRGVGGGRVGGQATVQADVDLAVDQVRADACERVEQRMPASGGKQQDVVGWGLRLGAGGGTDLLEQRVRLRQVDDPIDPDGGWRQAGAAQPDGVARAGVEVGGGLLGE